MFCVQVCRGKRASAFIGVEEMGLLQTKTFTLSRARNLLQFRIKQKFLISWYQIVAHTVIENTRIKSTSHSGPNYSC